MAWLPDEQSATINQLVDQLAAKGYRTLAVGKKSGDDPLKIIGLIPLYDPPRSDSRQVIAEMRNYGVRVKMVTGDHMAIAGHGTIYNTRTNGWFWKKPYPSWLLFNATFLTRIVGTLIAVYGIFITPIGWKYALWMWAYALIWFVFNDMVKIAAYKFLRSHQGASD